MFVHQTDRLILRRLALKDAPFILNLLNTPAWLENIGDKNVHNVSDAENYLRQGPLKSYQTHGFGLYLVTLKTEHTSIGICGLIKRDGLDFPDVGFALMPEYWGLGLASEAALATLQHAKDSLNIERVVGITNLENIGSMRVLENAGLRFEKNIDLPGYDKPNRLFVPKS